MSSVSAKGEETQTRHKSYTYSPNTCIGPLKRFLDESDYDRKQFQVDCFNWCFDMEENRKKIGPGADNFTEEEKYVENRTGGIIALEMGLGKTIIALALMACNAKKNTLIVVPKSLLSQWDKILKNSKVFENQHYVFHSSYNNVKKMRTENVLSYSIVLTTYSYIGSSLKPNKKRSILHDILWDRIICDEAHNACHSNTNAYRGLHMLRSDILWLVTGTPLQNKLKELFNLVDMIKPSGNMYERIYYRTKKSVGIEMPQLNEHNIVINWDNNEEKAFAQHIHSFIDYCNNKLNHIARQEMNNDGIIADIKALRMKYFTIARQVCIYPKNLTERMNAFGKAYQEFVIDESEEAMKMYGVLELENIVNYESKINEIFKTIKSRIHNGCGKIVMCHFHAEIDVLYELLSALGVTVVKFDGRSSKIERERAMTVPYDILLGQIKMCREGLNLQENYSEVYFTSPHFNPAVERQAIARCWRIGQKKEVNVFRFIITNAGNCIETDNDTIETSNPISTSTSTTSTTSTSLLDDNKTIEKPKPEYTMDTYCEYIQIKKKELLESIEEKILPLYKKEYIENPKIVIGSRIKIKIKACPPSQKI